MHLVPVRIAAERLGVSRQRVLQMLKEGKMISVIEYGRVLIEDTELERFRSLREWKGQRGLPF